MCTKLCIQLASESWNNLSIKFEELLLTFVLLWTWALLDRRAKVSNLNIFTIISLCRCYLSFANNSCVLLNSVLLLFNQLFISSSSYIWFDVFPPFLDLPAEQDKSIKSVKYFFLNMKITLFLFLTLFLTHRVFGEVCTDFEKLYCWKFKLFAYLPNILFWIQENFLNQVQKICCVCHQCWRNCKISMFFILPWPV
jgi:hypothetical protein